MNQEPANPGRREAREVQIQDPLRLTERHFPDRKNQERGRKKSKCVVCNLNGIRKDVIYECRECDKALCVVPCFRLYHTVRHLVFEDVED